MGDHVVINDQGKTTRIIQLVAEMCKNPILLTLTVVIKKYIQNKIMWDLRTTVSVYIWQEEPYANRWIRITVNNLWEEVMY